MDSNRSNKRIFKNTLMLYVRMLVSVCVNLYTSRVLLQLLGIEDFGVYNVVGGIIALMAFLNTSMAGSSSRFLAYEIGRGDAEAINKTFSSSMQSHILIAIIILVIGETLGLWFVNTQLVIPHDRYDAANILYQFSLLISLVSFLQVPYSADVIAREKFDVYAYIEIANVILKLCAVYLLLIIDFDKLVVYPVLLLLVALTILLVYKTYCNKNFEEATLSLSLDRKFLLPMLKFSGWDIYGNGCVVLGQQGTNILMNRFFGVAINAAIGVANQASSAVLVFVSNVTMALRPPIIKLYASKNIEDMQKLLVIAVVVCLVLAELICFPLCVMIKPLMTFWLVDIPAYASDFCLWMLIANGISVVNPLFVAVIHATGNIKKISIITGTLYLGSLIFACVAYYIFNNPVVTYKLSVLVSILVIVSNIYIIKRQIPDISLLYIVKSIFVPLLLLIISVCIGFVISKFIPESLIGFVIILVVNTVVLFLLFYFFWFVPKFGWNIRALKQLIG